MKDGDVRFLSVTKLGTEVYILTFYLVDKKSEYNKNQH